MNKLSIIIFLFIGFNLSAQQSEKIKIVATASMIGDMVQEIAGDMATVTNIVPIGGDPHIFDPTPSSAKMAAGADIIFKNGLTFEGWLNDLIENSGTKGNIVTVTDGLAAIESQQYQNATDPHAWMSVKLGLTYIENIKNALTSKWPEHAAKFEQNYASYKAELIELDQYIESKIASIPKEKRILITSHDAFQYYGRRYGIQLESILGVSTDADVQTSDIRRLTEVIKNSKVPAVFIESTINPKLLERIAKDNNVVIGGKLFADSLGDQDSPASTYVKMMRNNTDVIVTALMKDRAQKKAPADNPNKKPIWMYVVGALTVVGLILLIYARRKTA